MLLASGPLVEAPCDQSGLGSTLLGRCKAFAGPLGEFGMARGCLLGPNPV